MQKLTIKVTPNTDLLQAMDNFKSDCMRHGIPDDELQSLLEKVETEVTDLARRGRELSSIGSQFEIKRVFESESCQVVLDVKFGAEQSTLGSKLRSLFSKRRG